MNEQYIEKAKRRAWVERHFHNAGLCNEEVMRFRPLPSENFSEGFDAGVSFALSQQWVSVEERLPEDDYDVIACIKEREDHTLYCEIAYHFKGEWRTTNGEYIHPTHWFPIPKLNNEKD